MRGRRDWLGTLLGVATFLGGVGLLGVTFQLAYRMFETPPAEALGLRPGQPIQLETTGAQFAGILIRILLLALMGFVGSLIANRGVGLFGASRTIRESASPQTESSQN